MEHGLGLESDAYGITPRVQRRAPIRRAYLHRSSETGTAEGCVRRPSDLRRDRLRDRFFDGELPADIGHAVYAHHEDRASLLHVERRESADRLGERLVADAAHGRLRDAGHLLRLARVPVA